MLSAYDAHCHLFSSTLCQALAYWLAHLCVALHTLTNALKRSGGTALLPSTQSSTFFNLLLSNRYKPLPLLH